MSASLRWLPCLVCLGVVLAAGCKKTSSSSSTPGGGGGSGGNTTTGSGLLELDVFTAWDTSPKNPILQKACVVPSGTAIGTNIPCTAPIPEGVLHFSSLILTATVNTKGACSIMAFHPYYYRASNSKGFNPEWNPSGNLDCTLPYDQLSPDCFSGVGVDIMKSYGFPQFDFIYSTPDDSGMIAETFSAPSANAAKRFSGNRWTNNTLSYRKGSIANPPLADGYVADSMHDYLLECQDDYANLNYSISLTIQDINAGVNCDANDPTCNQYPNWGSTQVNDLSPGGTTTSGPPPGIISHTVPATGQSTPAVLNSTDFFVDVIPPSNTTAYLHVDGDWTQPCRTDVGNTNQHLVCILEIREEDLYAQGLSLSYQAPPEQCSYLRRNMYYYYQFKTGIAPTEVNETITNGAITALNVNGSIGETGVFLDNGSSVHCNFDYSTSLPPGPDCCEGEYVWNQTNQTVDSSGNVTSSTTTSELRTWPGQQSACLNGPAVGAGAASSAGIASVYAPSPPQPKDWDGFPEAILEFIGNQPVTGLFVAAAPITQQWRFSNVYLANWWSDPTHPITASAPVPASAPLAFWPANPAKAGKTTVPYANAYYRFDCLDNAGDYNNRLRVLVRSWSTVSEFTKQITGNSLLNGPQGLPFSDHDLLNFWTWPQVTNPNQGFGDTYPAFNN